LRYGNIYTHIMIPHFAIASLDTLTFQFQLYAGLHPFGNFKFRGTMDGLDFFVSTQNSLKGIDGFLGIYVLSLSGELGMREDMHQ